MLEVQHPVDYFKKEREVNEPVGEEQHTEQISKSHKFERNRRVDTHFSTGQQGLQLPEDFEIGEAVGGGDCFFDAVAKGLKQLKPNMEFTVKSLRMICKQLAVGNQQLKAKVIRDVRSSYDPTIVLPDSSISDDELWNTYLASIEHTSEDMKRMRNENSDLYKSLTSLKYGSTLQVPMWGRSDIEGMLICKRYNIKLHIVEKAPDGMWLNQIMDGSKSISVDKIDYNEANTIHIVNEGKSHFQPILKTGNTAQVSNIDEKDENPEPVEIEQPGTSERAGKKRPSIGEEDQSMVKKINLLSQEEDKLAHEYVKYFIIEFQVIIKFYKNYQGKTFSEMVNRGEAKRVVSEIFSGVVSALLGIFTHDTHKHGAIPAMTATSKNIFFPYANFIIESFLGDKEQKMKIKKKLEAITKDKSDEDLNKEVLEAAATIFYMYKTTLLENDDNVEKLAEVAVNKIISYLEEDTVGEIGNIENVILTAIKQKGELVEEHLKVYDEPTDPFTIDEIEKVKRLKESVLSELEPNKALDKVEVQKIVEEALENFYKKTKSEKQPPKGTMFDLNKPIENFTGRKKDLEDLHEKLSGQSVTAIVQKISELSINSQTSNSGNLGSNSQQASVSGLGGIGKTQLALKYAEKYSTDYDNNVIWINAQDISGSFERLASKLGIAKKDMDGVKKETRDLAQEIYEHFKEAKSLFIFDNVENYQQIEKYLPKQFVGNKPSILITSRYRNWENTRVEVLDLDVFTPQEATEFIKRKLKIASGDSSQDKKIDALAEKLERLPLALAQAVAYIKQSRNTNPKFEIDGYLAIYDEKNKQLLGSNALEKSNDPYTKTVLTTWQVTLDKIKEKGVDGQKAIEILNIMAYFNPDEISNKIFLQLESSRNVDRAIQLLKDYSMINEGAAQDKSNVHRLVQEVVRINLKDENKEKNILEKAIILDENKEKDILEKALEILNKTKKGGPKTRHQDDKLLSKSNEIHAAIVCHYASQYPDLENQVNVLFGDLHGSHILTYFAKKGNRKLLSKILQNDEVKNSQKAKNKALLQAKNYEIAEILVSHGANIDDLEITNLQNPHILRALLKADKIDQKKKNEYLFDAVFENESKLVELLMEYGADPGARAEAYVERDDDRSPILDKDDTILGAAIKLSKTSKKIISLLKKEKYRDSDDSQHSSKSKDKTSEEEELFDISEPPTPIECSSSQRKKRSANDICWEDADEPDKTKSHLGKVGKISHKLNSGLMIKDIGADIINGNYENVAVNLGLIGGGQVFGEAADKVLAKGVALEADKKLLGNSLKAASPFLKRGTAGFFCI